MPSNDYSYSPFDQYRQQNLLDRPISIFSDAYQTLPESTTTLRQIANTSENRARIEAIRAESKELRQKQLKKKLRAFTPVALLNHRKEGYPIAEQVKQQWPILAADVDKQENPGVDMAELKINLIRLPYVLLCAYSVRGGLWFVVRLPENQTPSTLAAHFRYLQWLFSKRFGINLDASKGGNPTHLRYVSYDTDSYINEYSTVMDKTYTPPPPIPKPRPFNFTQNADEEREKVELCLQEVLRRGTYIGDSYGEWYSVGCSLANTFGETGRDYYHLISQNYPNYQMEQTDKQFSACIRANSQATLGTFFYLCQMQGIKWINLV